MNFIDIDDPLPVSDTSAAGNEPSEDQISTLQDMGFSAAQAKKALRETVSSRPIWSKKHMTYYIDVEQQYGESFRLAFQSP